MNAIFVLVLLAVLICLLGRLMMLSRARAFQSQAMQCQH